MGAHHGGEGGPAGIPQHDQPLGQLPTFHGPHLHQRALGALPAGMPGIRGGARAVPLAGTRPRPKVPPAHGPLHARLEAASRQTAVGGAASAPLPLAMGEAIVGGETFGRRLPFPRASVLDALSVLCLPGRPPSVRVSCADGCGYAATATIAVWI